MAALRKLPGISNHYDEFTDTHIEGRTPEIRLIRAIFERALMDLMDEVKKGMDYTTVLRVHQFGCQAYPAIPDLTPRKGKGCRHHQFHISPYDYFFNNDIEDWSFLWCCQQISSDWLGYAQNLRRKINKNILLITVECQNEY